LTSSQALLVANPRIGDILCYSHTLCRITNVNGDDLTLETMKEFDVNGEEVVVSKFCKIDDPLLSPFDCCKAVRFVFIYLGGVRCFHSFFCYLFIVHFVNTIHTVANEYEQLPKYHFLFDGQAATGNGKNRANFMQFGTNCETSGGQCRSGGTTGTKYYNFKMKMGMYVLH
jgi:hypothetical protein